MSRYLGPIWRKSRSLNWPLLGGKEFSKGKKRIVPPGIHGIKHKKKTSAYSEQLKEKQKMRFFYGLRERQLKNLFSKLKNQKEKNIEQKLLISCESRLDNVIYRSGIVPTRRCARQLVNHGFFLVNEKKVNIPSFILKIGQNISFRKKDSLNNKIISESIKEKRLIPGYIDMKSKKDNIEIIYLREPNKNDKEIQEITKGINVSLIIEWYNRKV